MGERYQWVINFDTWVLLARRMERLMLMSTIESKQTCWTRGAQQGFNATLTFC